MQVNVRADEGGSEVSIDVRGREHGGEDYWDGNWLQTRVSVRAGAFRGAFDASLRVEEFIRMWNGVRVCMTALDGTFVFETMEEQLSIVAKGNGIGRFTAECVAQDAAGVGNELTFEFSFDQIQLAPLATELEKLIKTYPLVGKPR
ncbi:MAG: hypothetical protein E6I18_16900 [Chloroflexi bacterium]|nr:MAG: hypothetical protein E6I18_16900 [Chloroflexota bacterium]